jgi:hypothetical protein
MTGNLLLTTTMYRVCDRNTQFFALAGPIAGDAVANLFETAESFEIDLDHLAGRGALITAHRSSGSRSRIRFSPSRCRMRLTVAGERRFRPRFAYRCGAASAKASTAAHVAGGVWLGNERGLEERSCKPSTPSARKRPTHLATVFGVVLYRPVTAALLNPPSTTARTIASRPRGVRRAFLWLFIWSLRGTLKLRNLSFLGSDQMDNLLKDHI